MALLSLFCVGRAATEGRAVVRYANTIWWDHSDLACILDYRVIIAAASGTIRVQHAQKAVNKEALAHVIRLVHLPLDFAGAPSFDHMSCLSAVQLGLVATCSTKVTLQCHVSLHAWLDLDAKVCRHLCQPMLILLKCGALSK